MRSPRSLGDGGLSFTRLLPSLIRPRLCRHAGDLGHRARAAGTLRQARIVQGVGGATVDADRAARARVVVDDEDRGRRSTSSRTTSWSAPSTMSGGQHVDAVPRADVLARAAQDAVVGIEHQVLRRLHALGEPRGVHRLHDVVGVDVDLGLRDTASRRLPVSAGRADVVALAAELAAPVLHDRRAHQDDDDRHRRSGPWRPHRGAP